MPKNEEKKKKKKYKGEDGTETNLMMEPLSSRKTPEAVAEASKQARKTKDKGDSGAPLVGKKVSMLGRLDSCTNCVRYILVLGNCIFFFLGCTIIGLGIYVVVDKVSFVTGLFGLPLVAPASYLILASGCVVFIVSFVGCFGALFESRLLLAIYSGFLAVVLALSCIAFSLTVIFRSSVTDQIRLYMRRTVLYDYGIHPEQQWNIFVTRKWDQAQIKWQCCAVHDDTWSLYRQSAWYKVNRKQTLKNNLNLKDKDNDKNKSDDETNTTNNSNITSEFGHDHKAIADLTDLVPLVPESCCKINTQGHYVDIKTCRRGMEFFRSQGINDAIANTSNPFTKSINTKGCYGEGTVVMHEISRYLFCIGVITAVVVVGGLALSIQLARHV